MAANDTHTSSHRQAPADEAWLGVDALRGRLEEEIGRAERHGTRLSCLLVVIENLEEIASEHGGELREQTLSYVAGALRRELRRFDRIGRPSARELLIVLPGADGPRGEMVARRVLARLRTIKVEAREGRRELRISVGLIAWREGLGAEDLLDGARAASLQDVAAESSADAARAPGGGEHLAAEAGSAGPRSPRPGEEAPGAGARGAPQKSTSGQGGVESGGTPAWRASGGSPREI